MSQNTQNFIGTILKLIFIYRASFDYGSQNACRCYEKHLLLQKFLAQNFMNSKSKFPVQHLR